MRSRAPGNTLGLARLSTRARWSSLLAPPLVVMPRVAPFCAVADARRLPPRRGAYVLVFGHSRARPRWRALRSADPRPGPCLPAGGGLVAEGDPRRTLTFSTRGGVDARLISHRWPARTCPHSAPHLAMRLSLRSSLPCARACHPRPGLLGASTNPVFSLENWYASQFGE